MTEFTIVEPHVEFIEPPNSETYLEFLETCTRVCYKSEDRISPGSAEKLMTQVVKNYEHYSVTEHANAVLHLDDSFTADDINYIIVANPLMASRISTIPGGWLVSGNVRMWIEMLKNLEKPRHSLQSNINNTLAKKWPFFFINTQCLCYHKGEVDALDENPISNMHGLSLKDMKQHMTATFKLVGDRTMSHQLVRHRLFAFSQESQRYCNYGKKGFQFIVPPHITNKVFFRECAKIAYGHYQAAMRDGCKPEDARGLLPNCTKTEVVTTGTLGYWIDHIIPHRGHNPKAQWQIRNLVLDVEAELKERVPNVF